MDKKDNSAERLIDNSTLPDAAAVAKTKGRTSIYCLTIAGQVEGHTELSADTKTTKYEHIIPLLVAIEEDPSTKGLLVILNTVGGDVEAGLAIAELIAGMRKPTVSLVLGGGHSIGIPLAVSADRSFIVKTATMTVHPVRHSGTVIGVPQMMRHFDRIQDRITGFVCENSRITPAQYRRLLSNTGELVTDVGTVLCGEQAVKKGIIDEVGNLKDALDYLYARAKAAKPTKKSTKTEQ